MTDGWADGAQAGAVEVKRDLWDLIAAATVRIHRAGQGYDPMGAAGGVAGFLGSGCFVAPNWVLTCAHVVSRQEGGRVDIVHEGEPGGAVSTVAGEVAAVLPPSAPGSAPGDGNWPAPDLALVRLLEPLDHECVYLTERPAMVHAEEHAPLLYAGWHDAGGRLSRVGGTLTVQGNLGWGAAEEQLRLGGDIVPDGASGGPVVDPRRGAVIGIVKSRLTAGEGGTSVGVEQLRGVPVPSTVGTEHDDLYQAVCHAHDRYHQDRQDRPRNGRGTTWTEVQSMLGDSPARAPGDRPARAFTARRRTGLLGRLAELPPPVSTDSLVTLLEGLPGGHAAARQRPAPRSWRDGLGALYEAQGTDRGVELVILKYVIGVLRAERPYLAPGTHEAEEQLGEWVAWAAENLPHPARAGIVEELRALRARVPRPSTPTDAPLAPRHSVLLELTPRDWERDFYDWRLTLVPSGADAEVEPFHEDHEGTSLSALGARLTVPLTDAFRSSDEPGRPALLQVALPRQLLGLDVDAWEAYPGGPRLGDVRPVVVRCADHRPATEAEYREREERWRWTQAFGPRASGMGAAVLDCEDGSGVPVPPVEELRSLEYAKVPVLCRHAGVRDAESAAGLSRLVDGGFGVALWRRRRGSPDAVCADFHRSATDALARAHSAARLPHLVHELRAAVRAGRTETFWADGIALLYDDPGQPLPGSDDCLVAL